MDKKDKSISIVGTRLMEIQTEAYERGMMSCKKILLVSFKQQLKIKPNTTLADIIPVLENSIVNP